MIFRELYLILALMDMEILRSTCMKDTLCLGALSSLEKDMCCVEDYSDNMGSVQ